MGEGRGEGKSAEQPKRTVEFTRSALTLHPSPVRRERETRPSAEVFIQFLGSNVEESKCSKLRNRETTLVAPLHNLRKAADNLFLNSVNPVNSVSLIMPIYEFACPKCRVVFNFLSKRLKP